MPKYTSDPDVPQSYMDPLEGRAELDDRACRLHGCGATSLVINYVTAPYSGVPERDPKLGNSPHGIS